MFEFLQDVMLDDEQFPNHPNTRYPVSYEDIKEAEGRLGFQFPSQLRKFFQEIGCGFLKSSPNDISQTEFNIINRFLDPDEITDLFLGEDEILTPEEGFGENILPFFEVGDQLFIAIQLNSKNGNQVCWPFGDIICEDLITFTSKLAENPSFYEEDIE